MSNITSQMHDISYSYDRSYIPLQMDIVDTMLVRSWLGCVSCARSLSVILLRRISTRKNGQKLTEQKTVIHCSSKPHVLVAARKRNREASEDVVAQLQRVLLNSSSSETHVSANWNLRHESQSCQRTAKVVRGDDPTHDFFQVSTISTFLKIQANLEYRNHEASTIRIRGVCWRTWTTFDPVRLWWRLIESWRGQSVYDQCKSSDLDKERITYGQYREIESTLCRMSWELHFQYVRCTLTKTWTEKGLSKWRIILSLRDTFLRPGDVRAFENNILMEEYWDQRRHFGRILNNVDEVVLRISTCLLPFRDDKADSRLRKRASASYMKIRVRSSFAALERVSLVECYLSSTSFELWEDMFPFVQQTEAQSLVLETRWLAVTRDALIIMWMSKWLLLSSTSGCRQIWIGTYDAVNIQKKSTSVLRSRHRILLTHHVTCWNSNFSNSM